jgi:hypothetical protein
VQPIGPSRAWYVSSIDGFRASTSEAILGALAKNGSFAMLETQRDAWVAQIEFLRERLRGLSGAIFFEFSIPRMGRRIDVVLLIAGVICALEFKVGASTFDRAAIDQVWDYALDLKNFHEASHQLTIVPLLVATDAVNVPRRPSIAMPTAWCGRFQ